MNEISTSIGRLTQQLNEFKPVNEWNSGDLEGKVFVDIIEKLSKTEEKVNEPFAKLTKQSKAA